MWQKVVPALPVSSVRVPVHDRRRDGQEKHGAGLQKWIYCRKNVRKTLHEMLRDKAIPQARILEEINALIEDAGLPDEMKLSRSGLNRYATNVEQVGA